MPSSSKPILTYVFASLAGLLGAILGFIAIGLLADLLLGVSGMSDREGYWAMVAFLTFAPFGGIAGLIFGIWLVLRRYGGYRGFAGIAPRMVFVTLGLVAAAAFGLCAYTLTDDILVRNGPPAQAMFEIRFPKGAVLPAKLEGVSIDLNTDKNKMPSNFAPIANDGERPVISGAVDIYFRTSSRIIVLRMPGEPDRLFLLRLRSDPPRQEALGPWQHLDYVAEQGNAGPRKAGPKDDYDIRYRVERSD